MQDFVRLGHFEGRAADEALRDGWVLISEDKRVSEYGDVTTSFHMGLPAVVMAKDYGLLLAGLVKAGAIQHYIDSKYPERVKELRTPWDTEEIVPDETYTLTKVTVQHVMSDDLICETLEKEHDDPVLSLYVEYRKMLA